MSDVPRSRRGGRGPMRLAARLPSSAAPRRAGAASMPTSWVLCRAGSHASGGATAIVGCATSGRSSVDADIVGACRKDAIMKQRGQSGLHRLDGGQSAPAVHNVGIIPVGQRNARKDV
ncbi:hypothetical protein FB451DRAFT_1183875 [Mycena latifolia]|nr:hypothetical protein FB451DRAFT_1183875 [Mycena latifolia]